MNWKLIFSLSLFGLAMAFATVYWIPVRTEVWIWPFIMVISAYFIAKNTSNYFSNGILIGLLNSIWINIAHALLITSFLTLNSDMQNQTHWPLAGHVRLNLVIVGTIIGLVSGFIMGILAWIIAKIVKKPTPTTT